MEIRSQKKIRISKDIKQINSEFVQMLQRTQLLSEPQKVLQISNYYEKLTRINKASIDQIILCEKINYFEELALLYNFYSMFPLLKNLKILILNNQSLGIYFYDIFCYGLKNLLNLEHLGLANNKLSNQSNFEEFSFSLSHLSSLSILNLSDNGLCSSSLFQILFGSESSNIQTLLINLKVLNVSSYEINTISTEYIDKNLLNFLGNFKFLKELHLAGLGISEEVVGLGNALPNLKCLTVLDLRKNDLQSSEIRTLFQRTSQNHEFLIEKLLLSDNLIGNDGFTILTSYLHKFKRLNILAVDKNNINCLHKVEYEIPSTIKVLNLSSNKLNDDEPVTFENNLIVLSDKWRNLDLLMLNKCGLNNENLKLIFDDGFKNSLISLDLKFNQFKEEVISFLDEISSNSEKNSINLENFKKITLFRSGDKKLDHYLRMKKNLDKIPLL